MNKKQNGFTIIEVLIVVVVLALLGFVGFSAYRVMQKQHNSVATTEKAENQNNDVAKPINIKKYTNMPLQFSFEYPEDWKVEAKDGFFTTQAEPTVSIMITTDSNKSFEMTAHYGGKGGGPCESANTDKPHRLDAQCATTEILNVEKTPYAFKPGDVYDSVDSNQLYVLERKVTIPTKFDHPDRPAGTTHQVCMAFGEAEDQFKVKGVRFDWGVTPVPSPIFRNTKPSFFYLESCFADSSGAFLNSSDAKIVKDLYRSVRVTQ